MISEKSNLTAAVIGTLSASGYAGLAFISSQQKPNVILFILLFLFCFILYLTLLIVSHGKGVTRKWLYISILFPLLFRIITIFSLPLFDDDVYRYFWDGKAILNGVNPYRYAPADMDVQYLRDGRIYPRISFKEVPTIYPPLAEFLFTIPNLFDDYKLIAWRLLIFGFDVGCWVFIFKILACLKRPREQIIIWTWNPLLIKEGVGSGHVDVIAVFFCLAAIYYYLCRRDYLSYSFLALSALVKFYSLLFLPFMVRDSSRKPIIVFLAFIIAFYLPFLITSPSEVFSGIMIFSEYWEFGGAIYPLTKVCLELLGRGDVLAKIISQSAFLLIYLLLWITAQQDLSKILLPVAHCRRSNNLREVMDKIIYRRRFLIRQSFLAVCIGLLLSPVFNPWYFIWVLPLFAIELSTINVYARSWILLSGTQVFSYLYYRDQTFSWLGWALEYIPFFLVFAHDFFVGYICGEKTKNVFKS